MRRLASGGLIAFWLLAGGTASAAPVINEMSVHGFQIGKATTVTVRGRDLLPEPRLVLGVPVPRQVVVGDASESAVTFEVTVGEKAVPGLYNLRVATSGGISPGVVAAVDGLPQREFAPELKELPVALHGKVQGSAVVRTSFRGKKGQQVVIEAEALRLGSKLRPVLHLYDAGRRQLALGLPQTVLAGDARVEVTLPADGDYSIEMHDLEHAAGAPGHFRLKVGSFHYADLAYPPVVSADATTNLSLLGNIPAQTRVEVTPSNLVDFLPAPWPAGVLASGIRPRVAVSPTREVVEESFAAGPRNLGSLPVAVCGRLDQPGQVDEYQVAVSEGDRIRFEVFADRLGSPVDASLSLHGEKGNALASNDDNGMSADPLIDYTVPKGVGVISVRVSDLLQTGGPTSVYRLAVVPLDRPRAGFRLRLDADCYSVPRGTHRVLTVLADRQDYGGPIQLTWGELPPGVEADAGTIPEGASGALLTLKGVGEKAQYGMPTLRGVSVDPPLSSVAAFEEHPLASLQPWLKTEIAVALADRPGAPFGVEWNGLAADAALVLGRPLPAPVKFTRPPGSVGSVQLSAVVAQFAPIANGRPDPNRTIRGERPTVVLPVDPKVKAAADALAAADAALAKLKQTEKDAGVLQAAADRKTQAEKALADLESKQKNETSFNITVPVNVAETTCDLAIKAELLAADNRTVLAEAYTAVRRFAVVNPLQVVLADGGKYGGVLDPKAGASIDIKGSIDRKKVGFAGDVTLTVAGQPAGVAAPRVVVKAAEKDFTLTLKFPPSTPPGEITGVKLTASGPPAPTNARAVVQNELPLTLTLQRAP